MSPTPSNLIHVDVLIPVHNASATIQETVDSAMSQRIPLHLQDFFEARPLDVAVCCYNDGSTDDSWQKLEALQKQYDTTRTNEGSESELPVQNSTVLIQSSSESNGAPYARNQAAIMRSKQSDDHVFVWLDSDDTMHPHRISEQVHALLLHSEHEKNRLLVGSQFDRDPPDSTWHYAQWANNLTDERLMLERYREVTVLQPTWCMMRSRFEQLGGYITKCQKDDDSKSPDNTILRLVHANDTPETIRLAEDIRFLHAHLQADDGLLRLVRKPLVTYRHRAGQSQSSQTPRRLLLQLRTMAFEQTVLTDRKTWDKFVVWGAGRDGKEFVKALSVEARKRVVCMVDVDHKKIATGHYMYKEMDIRIPIVHFSLLAKDLKVREALQEAYFSQVDNGPGRISKERPVVVKKDAPTTTSTKPPPRKKFKVCAVSDLDTDVLSSLPVVVCVAMYRTNGVLEKNVASIDRTEGQDLWHFS